MLFVTLFAAVASPQVPASDKTMSSDDWHQTTIVSVGSPASAATYVVVQAGDLDGDGRADDAYLKLSCVDEKLREAWYQVKGPRDAASGMASGKRQHRPVTFVKEWGAATPQLSAVRPTYDIKTVKGDRRTASGEWTPIGLAKTDGLCAAAKEAAKTVTKTSSNIQNN